VSAFPNVDPAQVEIEVDSELEIAEQTEVCIEASVGANADANRPITAGPTAIEIARR
jgi:hypothetical protein